MKTYNLIGIVTIVLIFFSCKSYNKQDLTVIDNLQLGQKVSSFYKTCDSLGLKNKVFITKTFLSKDEKLENYALRYYFTERFNFSSYKKRGQDHFGIFYPTILTGTDNIFILQVILFHTSPPIFESSFLPDTYRDSLPVINQDINILLIEEIKNLLIQKYGTPMDTIKGEGIPIFIFINNEVKRFVQSPKDDGKQYVWETKALKIKFFTGIKNSKNWYTLEGNQYWIGLSPIVELQSGDVNCRNGAYISYEIQSEVITKLKLDKPNI